MCTSGLCLDIYIYIWFVHIYIYIHHFQKDQPLKCFCTKRSNVSIHCLYWPDWLKAGKVSGCTRWSSAMSHYPQRMWKMEHQSDILACLGLKKDWLSGLFKMHGLVTALTALYFFGACLPVLAWLMSRPKECHKVRYRVYCRSNHKFFCFTPG